MRQPRQGRQPHVGDLRAADVDGPQLLHRGELGNARVADLVVKELEVVQLRHLGQVGHGVVGHVVRVAEIQNADLAKLGKFLDARIGDVGVLQAEFAELGEVGQGRNAGIVDFRTVKVELDDVLAGPSASRMSALVVARGLRSTATTVLSGP